MANYPVADSIDREKGEFLAKLSLELRTPIYGIVGLTELALDEDLSPTVRDYLQSAQNSAGDLLQVINEILDYAKLESGSFELEPQAFKLRPLVQEVCDAISAARAKRGASFALAIAGSVPEDLFGDIQRLRHVLVNLLKCASQFSELSAMSLHVSSDIQAEQLYVQFDVLAPELELSAAERDAIFAQPLHGDFGGDSEAHARTNLGLAVALKLARVMGGVLATEPARPRGTRFCFRVPLASRQQSFAQESKKPSRVAQKRALRVLLAEDTVANQKIVKAILNKRGHIVEIARNGREVVDKLAHGTFDIVLMDVEMPIMDGLEATSRIRAEEDGQGPRVPIVAITAHVLPGDRERCLAAGMDVYLPKPIDTEELITAVETLSGKGTSASARPVASGTSSNPLNTMESERVFEIEPVLKRLGNNRQLFQSLIEFYVEDCPMLISQVRGGLEAQDKKQVALAAHSLKGLAANFDAHAATRIAGQVEKAANEGDLVAATKLMEQLTPEFEQLTQALLPHRDSK